MTKLVKILLPLVDKFELADISKDTGFVDAYLIDDDRPSLTSHLFLLYDWGQNKNIDLFYKYPKFNTFYNYKIIYVDKKPMIVYCFNIVGIKLTHLLDGGGILDGNQRLRVLQFWQFTDDEINKDVVRGTMTIGYENQYSVPREDYMPTDDEDILEKIKGGTS